VSSAGAVLAPEALQMNELSNPSWRVGGDPRRGRIFFAIEAEQQSAVFSFSFAEAERLNCDLAAAIEKAVKAAAGRTTLGDHASLPLRR
jgi:hypothetical protein